MVRNTGTAVISIGSGYGGDRVEQAIRSTKAHPLLTVVNAGAKGALIHVVGGSNLTISDATRIGEGVTDNLASDANVIFGARMLPELNDQLRVMSVITGVKARFGEARNKEAREAHSIRLEAAEQIY